MSQFEDKQVFKELRLLPHESLSDAFQRVIQETSLHYLTPKITHVVEHTPTHYTIILSALNNVNA